MLAKALKSFRGRYGLIRAGSTFNCEPGYYGQLAKKGWVEAAKGGPEPESAQKPGPGPADNRDKGGAPNKAGKGEAGTGKPPAQPKGPPVDAKGTGRRRGGGAGVTSRSLRQDLPSRDKTQNSSDAGGKSPADQENAGQTDASP
jgi:hypothetical protein